MFKKAYMYEYLPRTSFTYVYVSMYSREHYPPLCLLPGGDSRLWLVGLHVNIYISSSYTLRNSLRVNGTTAKAGMSPQKKTRSRVDNLASKCHVLQWDLFLRVCLSQYVISVALPFLPPLSPIVRLAPTHQSITWLWGGVGWGGWGVVHHSQLAVSDAVHISAADFLI